LEVAIIITGMLKMKLHQLFYLGSFD